MRLRLVVLSEAVVATAAALAGTASASGPAAPGKQLIQLDCQGLGPITVSVQRGENSNGAGQILDMKGHGIPVSFTFTITDVRQGFVIDSESSAVGTGNAHHNQPTTECTGVSFDDRASNIFGTDLPQGVGADDEILGTIDVQVVLKQ
jgi:hypothetical protein